MKKIFSVLIALAIVFSMTVPAMAAESYGYMGDGEPYGSGQIEVTHHSYSTFQLDIPLYADSSMPNYITAYNPNLEDGYQIEIYVTNLNEDGTIDMIHTSGAVSQMVLYNESDGLQLTYNNPLLATFTIEDFDDTNTAVSSFWIQGGDHFNMKAGTHTSTICYRIQCNPINQ